MTQGEFQGRMHGSRDPRMSDKLCLAEQRKVQLSANKREGGGGLLKCCIIYSLSSYSLIKFKLYTEHGSVPGTSEELNI